MHLALLGSFAWVLVGAVSATSSAPLQVQDVAELSDQVIQVFVDPEAADLERRFSQAEATPSGPGLSSANDKGPGLETSHPLIRRVASKPHASTNLVEEYSVADIAASQKSEYNMELEIDAEKVKEGTNGLARIAIPKECVSQFDQILASQAKDVGSTHVGDARTLNIKCPAKDFRTELFASQVLLNDEYFHLAKGGHCNVAKGMWKTDKVVPALRCKYEAVANLFKLGPNDAVLDWGAGCGHGLDILAREHSLMALGLDLVDENVQWAEDNLKHIKKNCLADGSDLSFIATNSLDALISNGAVHHLPKASQCQLMKTHVLRVLRPGGCAWFGWQGVEGSGSEPAVNEDFWKSECFTSGEAAVFTANEMQTFGMNEFSSPNAYSLFVCKPS